MEEDDDMYSDNGSEVEETQSIDREDVVDDLRYDPFNLAACSFHPLRWKESSKLSKENSQLEETLLQESTRVAQLLYKK